MEIVRKLNFDQVALIPTHSDFTSREEVNLAQEYLTLHSSQKIQGTLIFASNMDGVGTISAAKVLNKYGLFTLLRTHYEQKALVNHFLNYEDSHRSFYTTGINKEDWTKLNKVADIVHLPKICIDTPNGYLECFLDYIKRVRDKFPTSLIVAGNVCTPEGVYRIFEAGADIAKVGIGQGALCATKNKAGVTYPQFSVCQECYWAANSTGGLILSDGGCKTPADIVKAIWGGAHGVVLGSMLSAHDESECDFHEIDGVLSAFVYGMASEYAANKHNGGLKRYRASEGKEMNVPAKGPIEDTILDILGSLRSAGTYTGMHLQEAVGKGKFIESNS